MGTAQLISTLREAAEFNLAQLRALEKETASAGGSEIDDLRRRAMALYYARNDAQAASLLNLLCKLSGDADAFATLAQARARAGDFQRAEEAAEAAIKLDTGIAAAHQVLVATRLARGDRTGAKQAAAALLNFGDEDPRNKALAGMAGATEDNEWSKGMVQGVTGFPNIGDDATQRMIELGVLLSADRVG
jgi:tetratricopeptide (TPR) repeat protein